MMKGGYVIKNSVCKGNQPSCWNGICPGGNEGGNAYYYNGTC
jgi:hypothetical protein